MTLFSSINSISKVSPMKSNSGLIAHGSSMGSFGNDSSTSFGFCWKKCHPIPPPPNPSCVQVPQCHPAPPSCRN